MPRRPRSTGGLPQSNIDALRRAGALKTIQATRNGGYALGIRSHLDVMSALGRGCGSTAWVAGVVHAHSWLVSHFPEQGQDDIYGNNPDAVRVGSHRAARQGRAHRRRLSGWKVCGRSAPVANASDWLLLGAVVFDEAGNEIDQGDFMVPTSEVTIKDDWYVSGLAGTGSCTMVVDRHRRSRPPLPVTSGAHHGPQPRREPARRRLGAALCTSAGADHRIVRRSDRHRQAGTRRLPGGIKGKIIAYTADPQEPHPFTHIRLGDAASRIREGELLLYAVADELDATAQANGEVPLLRRAEMRNDCATAVRRLLEGVEILFRESGATGVRTSSPMNRALADIQTINNHGLMKLETNQEMYGRLLLGLEPNTPLI